MATLSLPPPSSSLSSSRSPADAIAVIDPLFSVLSAAADQVAGCYFTEHNVNHTREVYRNRGGLKALQRIISSLAPTFEAWMASLNLQTPEAIKIVRKSLELGSFWASVCFWKEPEWSEDEYVRRLRCPALWTAASWVMDMLNDELGVPTEAVIQIHQDGWDGVFVFDSLPGGVAHVNECLRAMRHGVWTVRQWMDEYWWAHSYYPQLEGAVKGYLDTQYQRTSFSTLDEFLEYRCKSAGGAPIHLLMAILKRDVGHCFSNKDTSALVPGGGGDHTRINESEEVSSSGGGGLSSDQQSSTDDEYSNNNAIVSNPTNNNGGGASSDEESGFVAPEQFSFSLQPSPRRSNINNTKKAKKVQLLRGEGANKKLHRHKPSVACSVIPMRLLDLSTVQTTAINDILDHERDAAEGSPNLVNFMHSQLLLQSEAECDKDMDTPSSSPPSSSSSSSPSLSDALASALLFHRRTTHELYQHVGCNPAGMLEKQAAQVAYGCYLMEVLHPRYSELAGQIAALYPPLTNTNNATEQTNDAVNEAQVLCTGVVDPVVGEWRGIAKSVSSLKSARAVFVLFFKLFVLLLLVTVCNQD